MTKLVTPLSLSLSLFSRREYLCKALIMRDYIYGSLNVKTATRVSMIKQKQLQKFTGTPILISRSIMRLKVQRFFSLYELERAKRDNKKWKSAPKFEKQLTHTQER